MIGLGCIAAALTVGSVLLLRVGESRACGAAEMVLSVSRSGAVAGTLEVQDDQAESLERETETYARRLTSSLGIGDRTARDVARILAERDLEAKRLWESVGRDGKLPSGLEAGPRLLEVERRADRRILERLSFDERRRFLKARDEGVIPGCVDRRPTRGD